MSENINFNSCPIGKEVKAKIKFLCESQKRVETKVDELNEFLTSPKNGFSIKIHEACNILDDMRRRDIIDKVENNYTYIENQKEETRRKAIERAQLHSRYRIVIVSQTILIFIALFKDMIMEIIKRFF